MALFGMGLVMGHVSAGLRHIVDRVRIEHLETAMDMCDTQNLFMQKQMEEDREAYFRECSK